SDTCTYLRQSYRPFLFSDPSTSQIYTLSLHDALPISVVPYPSTIYLAVNTRCGFACKMCDVGMDQYDTQFYKIMSLSKDKPRERSEEHTSELQSRGHLVCRLLLEKKKTEYKGTRQAE